MQLSLLMNKYQVESNEVDTMVEAVLGDRHLNDVAKCLGNRYTCEQIFNLCRALATEILDADIEELAPTMTADRNRIASKHYERWAKERMANSQKRQRDQERRERIMGELLEIMGDEGIC